MAARNITYSIRIKRSAEKEMDQLPAKVFQAARSAILNLETTPRPEGSKKLRGFDKCRLRLGDDRILYTIDDLARIVEIMAIGHRKDVYRGL